MTTKQEPKAVETASKIVVQMEKVLVEVRAYPDEVQITLPATRDVDLSIDQAKALVKQLEDAIALAPHLDWIDPEGPDTGLYDTRGGSR